MNSPAQSPIPPPSEARLAPKGGNPQSPSLFFIAGEASGDAQAADVIAAIKAKAPHVHCFGAGGPKMQAAGMELVLDLTEHAVMGFVEVLRNYFKFFRFFYQLLRVVKDRKPDAIVLVDSPGFNLRFAKAIHRRYRSGAYQPKVIYYISPQVWAWGERRVRVIERCVDLLISIFPFEKAWYAQRAPKLRVEFVGHPMVSRYARVKSEDQKQTPERIIALLPGSREREVLVHWPIIREAARQMLQKEKAAVVVLAASDRIEKLLTPQPGSAAGSFFRISRNLSETLSQATVVIAASGTVTLECAFFGAPTVVMYKVAWLTFVLGRMLVKIRHFAMPNVLAGETIYPEFVWHPATPEMIAREALDLLADEPRRAAMKVKLATVIESLGPPGASERAADKILEQIRSSAAQ